MMRSATLAILLALVAILPLPAAADAKPATGADRGAPPADTGDQHRPMNMNEPMATGMMKKGMTEGDVKKAEEERARQLAPMMEQEEASMPPPQKAKP
jgi:hypothetical protein